MFYVIYGWLDFEGFGSNPDKLFVRTFQTENDLIEFDKTHDMRQYHVYTIIKGREQVLKKEVKKENKFKKETKLVNKTIITDEEKAALIEICNKLPNKIALTKPRRKEN